jgi:hypothetical protein
MPKPKQPPRRRPKPKPKPRKPPKTDAEKEKARKRASLIRRIVLLTLFVALLGIFLYNNRDYFMPALEKYSVYDLLPQKDKTVEMLKAAKSAEADSVKTANREEADKAKAAKKAAADSIKIAKKETADSINAAKGDWEDRLAAKMHYAVNTVKSMKIWEADTAKAAKKAEAKKAKADKAERKRVRSVKAKHPDEPKEPKELKSLDEILGGPEFVDNSPFSPKPESPYSEPDRLPEIAKAAPPPEDTAPPPYYAEPEPIITPKTKTAAAPEAEMVVAADADMDSVKPPKDEPAPRSSTDELIEIVKNFVKEKISALVKLVKPESAQVAKSDAAPPPKPKQDKLADAELAIEDAQTPAEPAQTAKPELIQVTKSESVPPPTPEPVKTAESILAPPPKPDALKIDEPNIALPPLETESVKKEAKPPAPAALPEDTFYLSNIPCKLADRDDLTIYLTAELIFNGEPIRQEIIFKRGALTAVAGNVVRGHEYGNVSTAQISKDLLMAFNDILLAGDLNRVDVKDFRVEPNSQ